MKTLADVQAKLDQVVFDEYGDADYIAMNEIVVLIRQLSNPRQAVPLLIQWFEAHGKYNLGTPGPFVHFIEERLDYFELLEASLVSRPTSHTTWMANRIANSGPDRASYWVAVLEQVTTHPLADVACKEAAQSFIRRLRHYR